MQMDMYGFILAGFGALAAGFINALAGGGTLVSFPILTAIGLPAVSANVTNTVALCPGYVGGVWAQWKDLKDQKNLLRWYLPAGALGGLIGGVLLLNSGEKSFRALVPFFILFATFILAISDRLKSWLAKRPSNQALNSQSGASKAHLWGSPTVFLSAIYGGYFGAGLGVVMLANLGLVHNDTLTRLNGLKQAISFAVNVTAAIFFVFSDQVNWPVVAVMAIFSWLGGALGGRLAGKINPDVLRWAVVCIGLVVSIIYFVRG